MIKELYSKRTKVMNVKEFFKHCNGTGEIYVLLYDINELVEIAITADEIKKTDDEWTNAEIQSWSIVSENCIEIGVIK